MLRGSDPAKCQQWAERLERFGKSGQGVAEFCRAEQVSVPSFYQWRRKLEGGRPSNGKPVLERGRRGPSAFKSLHVVNQDASASVKVRLRNGVVIDLGSNVATIQRIVAQLLDHQA